MSAQIVQFPQRSADGLDQFDADVAPLPTPFPDRRVLGADKASCTKAIKRLRQNVRSLESLVAGAAVADLEPGDGPNPLYWLSYITVFYEPTNEPYERWVWVVHNPDQHLLDASVLETGAEATEAVARRCALAWTQGYDRGWKMADR